MLRVILSLVFVLVFFFGSTPSIDAASTPTPLAITELNVSVKVNTSSLTNSQILVNQPFNYTVTVTNNGPDTAGSVGLEFILSGGTEFLESDNCIEETETLFFCDVFGLGSGSSEKFEIKVNATSLGSITIQGDAISDTFDRNPVGWFSLDEFALLHWDDASADPLDNIQPSSLAVDSAGNVFVGETFDGGSEVFRFDSSGTLLNALGFPQDESEPGNMDFRVDGKLIFPDRLLGQLWLFNADGTLNVAPWDSGYDEPLGVAVNSSGDIFISEINAFGDLVHVLDSSLNPIDFIISVPAGMDLVTPSAVAIDDADNVYIADTGNQRIIVLDSNLDSLFDIGGTSGCGDGQFVEPVNVVVDEASNVYVTDRSCHALQVFDSNGSFLFRYGNPDKLGAGLGAGNTVGLLDSPNGVAVDSEGFIYVAEESPTALEYRVSKIGPIAASAIRVSTVVNSTTTSGGGSGGGGSSSSPSFDPPQLLLTEDTPPVAPITIDGKKLMINDKDFAVPYTTESISDQQPVTEILGTDKKTELRFTIFSPLGSENIAHASLYTNLVNGMVGTADDTAIIYDKNTGVQTLDKTGLFANADVRFQTNGDYLDVIFDIEFAKQAPTSDIFLKIWDTHNYALYAQIHDFWQVDDSKVLVEKYTEEYLDKVYENLAAPVFPPVEIPIIESYNDVDPPQKITLPNEDTFLKQLTLAEDPEEFAKKIGLEYKDGEVRVLIILDTKSEVVINQIKEFATVESSNQNNVQATIVLENLENLYGISGIIKVQPTSHAIQTSVTSEGLDFIKAQKAHNVGLGGEKIKIAILDLAFDVSNPEISENIVHSKSFRHDFNEAIIPITGYGGESIHGTAVAEIVTDIAPGSEIFLYTFASEVEFLDAMDYAMNKKVDLITMSAGWVNYPTDGTSEMVKKIEKAISSGIPFVVSAGNYAQTHWEGQYLDGDSNGWHEFAKSDEGLSVSVSYDRVIQRIPIVMFLTWDSPTGAVYDFDLTLTNEAGDEVAYSSNLQKSKKDIAFEYIVFTPEESGKYSLGINYQGTSSPDAVLEIFNPSDRLEYPVSKGSVSVPTDAKGIISVGALNHNDSKLEPFSSQGPTNNCKQVPSLMGPDAVTTSAYNNHPFYGTSAAAPHVAGLVALLLEQNPEINPKEILSVLTKNSNTDLKSYDGLDNVYGFGAATSEFLANSFEIFPFDDTINGCLIGTLQAGEEIIQIVQEKTTEIPAWIKNNAAWWAEGQIDDVSFIQGIQFLIKEGIMTIPPTAQGSGSEGDEIPAWIKNNAGWWADGSIDDASFMQGLQYLIKEGILSIT